MGRSGVNRILTGKPQCQVDGVLARAATFGSEPREHVPQQQNRRSSAGEKNAAMASRLAQGSRARKESSQARIGSIPPIRDESSARIRHHTSSTAIIGPITRITHRTGGNTPRREHRCDASEATSSLDSQLLIQTEKSCLIHRPEHLSSVLSLASTAQHLGPGIQQQNILNHGALAEVDEEFGKDVESEKTTEEEAAPRERNEILLARIERTTEDEKEDEAPQSRSHGENRNTRDNLKVTIRSARPPSLERAQLHMPCSRHLSTSRRAPEICSLSRDVPMI